jgi:hypothetical protein
MVSSTASMSINSWLRSHQCSVGRGPISLTQICARAMNRLGPARNATLSAAAARYDAARSAGASSIG